jgi:hypothetical protein
MKTKRKKTMELNQLIQAKEAAAIMRNRQWRLSWHSREKKKSNLENRNSSYSKCSQEAKGVSVHLSQDAGRLGF